MRVALSFPGCHRRGGVERVMLECANFLQARGHETHAYAIDWDHESLHPQVVQHNIAVRAHAYIPRLFGYLQQSRREIQQLKPAPHVTGGFGIEAPPGGVVWMQSVHRAWLEISGQQRTWKGRLRQRLNLSHPVILSLEKSCLGGRRYKQVVALSAQVKSDIMRFYGVPSEDIHIIPNGYTPAEFNVRDSLGRRGAMRSELGYGDADRVVVFVANELERKGFAPLLRAIGSLNDPRLHLLAVGRLNATTYAAEIEQLGMRSRVRFTGPTSEVARYYSAADLFALPTQYEAWGLVIVEAMACGLPVLTSRLAGAAIAVEEGRTGALLDNPQDAQEIASKLGFLLAQGPFEREAISVSVRPYAWDQVLLKYEDLLSTCARL